MNSYRLYVLSPQERVADAREAQFPDDNTALAQADALRQDNYAVEVWVGERLVGRVGGEFNL
jgi:hypothetical protein